jgi:uncharacterized protein (TIGR02646 family)
MRHIEDYFDTIPNSLLPLELERKGIIQRILNDRRVKLTDYNRDNVKVSLFNIFGSCCAYCEEKVDNYAPIEHFRPKHEITGVNTEGYYWLGCHWTNFLLSCNPCNSSFKKNNFPITGIRASIMVSNPVNRDVFYANGHILSASLQAEQALLLHPVLDNPDDYLMFEEDGTVSAKNGNLKAITSIECYGLSNWEKRQELIAKRQVIVLNVTYEVYHSIKNYVNDERLYIDLLKIHLVIKRAIDLKNEAEQYEPFSAIRRSCLVNFKTFFIDKFNGIDKSRLEVAYQKVVNQIQ